MTTTIKAQVWECVNAQRRSSFAAISLRLNQFRLERTADRKKHKKIGPQVKDALEQIPKKEFKDFKSFHADRKQKAKKLEAKYGPKVKKKVKGKTVKLKVKFNPVAKDEKDGDVDFKVVIAPNATIVPGAAGGGTSDRYPNGWFLKSRKIENLWEELDPKLNLPGEKKTQAKKRSQLAKTELFRRYGQRGGGMKGRAEQMVKFHHGQKPRKIKTATGEESLNSNAHISQKHIFDAGGRANSVGDLAFRTLRGTNMSNQNLTPKSKYAGAFQTSASANKALRHFWSSELVPNWKEYRLRLASGAYKSEDWSQFGEDRSKMINIGGSFSAKVVERQVGGNYAKITREHRLPYYFASSNRPSGAALYPPAAAHSKLKPHDSYYDSSTHPFDTPPGTPKNLTKVIPGRGAQIRLAGHKGTLGGWYINSAWPGR